MTASEADFDEILRRPFRFTARPSPLSAEDRPLWRLAILATGLAHSRAKKASITKLLVLGWAARSAQNRAHWIAWANRSLAPTDLIIRFDPLLMRAARYGTAEGLFLHVRSTMLKVTPLGEQLAERAWSIEGALRDELTFMRTNSRTLTEAATEQLVRAHAQGVR